MAGVFCLISQALIKEWSKVALSVRSSSSLYRFATALYAIKSVKFFLLLF